MKRRDQGLARAGRSGDLTRIDESRFIICSNQLEIKRFLSCWCDMQEDVFLVVVKVNAGNLEQFGVHGTGLWSCKGLLKYSDDLR